MLLCKKKLLFRGDQMPDIANQCKRYLLDTLGINAHFSKYAKPVSIPFFLQDIYDFFNLSLKQQNYIALVPKNEEGPTPATIRKHIDIVEKKLNLKAIFLQTRISSFNRRRLIEQKVPFIIPHNQMYLPEMAIDLREHFVKMRSRAAAFGPSTQAVVLYALTQQIPGATTPKELAEKLGYSKMTMSRSIDEIEAAELAEVVIKGKNRLVRFEKNRRNLWNKALPYLKTPVKEIVWVKSVSNQWKLCEAGMMALAHYSMMTEPKQPVYAIRDQEWRNLKQNYSFEISKFPDEAEGEFEVWRYDPRLFAKDQTVDPFSLYLSLRDVKDERIESAIEEMMEKIQW